MADDTPTGATRRYHSPLREAQAEATRTLILDTLAEMVAEGNLVDLSVRELASRAGMSERTVYRHFPDRATLFEALIDKTAAELGWEASEVRLGVDSYADIVAGVERSFLSFEREETPTRVAIQLGHLLGTSSTDTLRRNTRHRRMLDDFLPGLSDAERDRLFAILRVVMSSRTWLRLKDEFGLDGEVSGPLVAWAIRLMVEDARAHGVPGAIAEEETGSGA